MAGPIHFKCGCQHCGGHIEFPTEAAGLTVDCPHCGNATMLVAEVTQTKSFFSAKRIFIVAGVLLIIAASIFGGVLHFKRSAERHKQETEAARIASKKAVETEAMANDPLAHYGWRVSKIVFEQTSGSTIVHAVGKLTNDTDRSRFGVKIQLDLFDAANQKIGVATDYQATIEAHGQWKFSALVVNSKALSAKVAVVTESP